MMLRWSGSALAAWGVFGCSAAPATPPIRLPPTTPARPRPAGPVRPLVSSAAASDSPRLGLLQTLCAGRAGCTLKRTVATAPGEHGEVGVVAVTSTPAAPDEPCVFDSVWVARMSTDQRVLDYRQVGSGCAEDTPYGAACDAVLINVQAPKSNPPHSVVVSWQSPGPGCGGWTRVSGDIEVSLDSMVVLRRSQWSSRAAGPDDSTTKKLGFHELPFRD